MGKLLRGLSWALPLLLSSTDAWAWGLYTHVYFTQLLLWSIPLLDPHFRRALLKFPRRVLAGACLPDLSLFGRRAGTRAFDITHQWGTAERLLRESRDDGERALALGFASHLLVDVIAHNHFVPCHQDIWLDLPVLTHAVSEWAMDHYLSPGVLTRPQSLLTQDLPAIVRFAADHFGCGAGEAQRAMAYLARGDAALRWSGLPDACFRWARVLDRRVRQRFDYYLGETSRRLHQINRVLAGERPAWQAEVPDQRETIASGDALARLLKDQRPLPLDLFYRLSETSATTAPMAAPASTSLG